MYNYLYIPKIVNAEKTNHSKFRASDNFFWNFSESGTLAFPDIWNVIFVMKFRLVRYIFAIRKLTKDFCN